MKQTIIPITFLVLMFLNSCKKEQKHETNKVDLLSGSTTLPLPAGMTLYSLGIDMQEDDF